MVFAEVMQKKRLHNKNAGVFLRIPNN